MNDVKEREKKLWESEYQMLLDACNQDVYATNYISSIFKASQLIDDLVDEKSMDVETRMLWAMNAVKILMIDIPANPFFQHYREQLCSSFLTSSSNWMLSTYLEGSNNKSDKIWAHVLRDNLESHLQYVISLISGIDTSHYERVKIHKLYHPTEYDVEEFNEFIGGL